MPETHFTEDQTIISSAEWEVGKRTLEKQDSVPEKRRSLVWE